MKDKKIAIYIILTIIVFSGLIFLTIYLFGGKKKPKNENYVKTQNNSIEDINIQSRKINKNYENQIYTIELYSDGTATTKIKSDVNLWGDLENSKDEKFKKEKTELKSILNHSRQIDSNNKKIEEVFISKYIGDIYNNYNYGKAIIKCEGNIFYLIDLVADNKTRIISDWTQKCKGLSNDKIFLNLQNECLSEIIKLQKTETNKIFSGIKTDSKFKYLVCFDGKGEYGIYINSLESDELLLYGKGIVSDENVDIISSKIYYKYSFAKPNGGSISGKIIQNNIDKNIEKINEQTQTTSVNEDLTQNEQKNNLIAEDIIRTIYSSKTVVLELNDISSESSINFSTNGEIELNSL